jgi:hypothetical protein
LARTAADLKAYFSADSQIMTSNNPFELSHRGPSFSVNEAPRSKAPRYLCEILQSPSTLLRQGYGGFSSPSSSQQAAGYSAQENKTRSLAVKLSILLKAFDFSWQSKKARRRTSVPIHVRRTGFNKSMFEHNSCPGTLVFPTGVSIVLLSEMTTARTSFVILEKDHALIERRSVVHELLPRLTVNSVTERRGRTRQIHRKTKLVEKTDLAQLTHGPAKHCIDKVRREIRRHEYLYS